MKAAVVKQLKEWYGALEEMREKAGNLAAEMENVLEERSDKWKESEAGWNAIEEMDNIVSFVNHIDRAMVQIDDYIN